MEGSIVAPAERRLVDYLNGALPVLRMVSVVLPPAEERHAFIAFRRDAIRLVIPQATSSIEVQRAAGGVRRRVSAFIDELCVTGSIRIPLGRSVASHLKEAPAFVAIEDAQWSNDEGTSFSAPLVIVNQQKAFALIDRI